MRLYVAIPISYAAAHRSSRRAGPVPEAARRQYNYPMANDMAARVNAVLDRIETAKEKAGVPTKEITVVAVGKTRPVEDLLSAYACGLCHFGENRIGEAADKAPKLPRDAVLHGVGHIQRNKAKTATEVFSWIHSIDKPRTVHALSRHSGGVGADRPLNVLIEVNTTGEEAKSGVRDPGEIPALAEEISQAEGLRLRGLMTMAPFDPDGDSAAVHRSFATLRELFDKLAPTMPNDFDTLSMGMSNDFPAAISEGATMVRIGTAIFGPRDTP